MTMTIEMRAVVTAITMGQLIPHQRATDKNGRRAYVSLTAFYSASSEICTRISPPHSFPESIVSLETTDPGVSVDEGLSREPLQEESKL